MSKIVGIDLGTTFSVIAILDDIGNPEILSDPDNNNKITPSVVYIGKNDKVFVGEKAKDAAIAEPERVISAVKRKMEEDVLYEISKGDWVEGGKKDKSYTPSQISSLILSKLKDYASGIKKVVITVPAMFPEKARSATMDAAKIAGMEVLELINEPTAAILHYANLPGVSVSGRVLVFDLGGGTFDVSIANVQGKAVEVITSRGDKYLGGIDFDGEIVKILSEKYKKEKGSSLKETDKKLLDVAEKLKKVLSVKDKASEVIDGPKGPLKIEITRAQFEKSIQLYLEKIKMLVEESLEAAKCNHQQISQTLLVGGSTRIPCVIELVKKIMKKAPTKGVNVDEAVACGAAIYAGLLSKKDLNTAQKKSLNKIELEDICNHYLGTLVVVKDEERNIRGIANKIIIERDTKLPCSKTVKLETLVDDQEVIECSVTQSEGPEKEQEFVTIIHQSDLALPKGRPAGQPIEVTYSYDKSGTIHCEFLDVKSKEKHEVDLKPTGSKTIQDLKDNLDFTIE
jgi:molecular chaperone DnaK